MCAGSACLTFFFLLSSGCVRMYVVCRVCVCVIQPCNLNRQELTEGGGGGSSSPVFSFSFLLACLSAWLFLLLLLLLLSPLLSHLVGCGYGCGCGPSRAPRVSQTRRARLPTGVSRRLEKRAESGTFTEAVLYPEAGYVKSTVHAPNLSTYLYS